MLCLAALPCPFPEAFIYRSLAVADSPETDLAAHFEASLAFIDAARASGGVVFVHCFAGRSRAVTVAAAWLIRAQGLSLDQALAHIRAVRPSAAPNSGFLKQLAAFAKQTTSNSAAVCLEAPLGKLRR